MDRNASWLDLDVRTGYFGDQFLARPNDTIEEFALLSVKH
jgi:hypothetical protein